MNRDIRRYIANIMAPGDHRHESMSDAAKCDSCGLKFQKARKEYDRLRITYPDKFIRQEPDKGYSRETQNMGDMLTERLKQDKLYREHLRKLAFGTSEEKQRELKRMKSGFYKRHTGDNIRKYFT